MTCSHLVWCNEPICPKSPLLQHIRLSPLRCCCLQLAGSGVSPFSVDKQTLLLSYLQNTTWEATNANFGRITGFQLAGSVVNVTLVTLFDQNATSTSFQQACLALHLGLLHRPESWESVQCSDRLAGPASHCSTWLPQKLFPWNGSSVKHWTLRPPHWHGYICVDTVCAAPMYRQTHAVHQREEQDRPFTPFTPGLHCP